MTCPDCKADPCKCPRCPKCGYTRKDQQIHGDHYLCTGTIPKPSRRALRRHKPELPGETK